MPIAEAKWSKYEQLELESDIQEDMFVNADGTYTSIVESRSKILKEHGREIFAPYRIDYNNQNMQITILEAKTICQGKEYKVVKNMIQDKAVSSLKSGFDTERQIAIAFPKIELGSEIYLKYKIFRKKAPIKNFFGEVLYYTGSYIKSYNTRIQSKIPLKVKVNDPKNVLKVSHEPYKQDTHNIVITLEKPIQEWSVTNERSYFVNKKYRTWVSLSNVSSWKEFAQAFATEYYKVINQPLPKSFVAIAEVAATKEGDEATINYVTSELNKQIQYMGDWRTVKGGHFPRDLEKTAHFQMGDCKDFSAATASILQKLGYQVQPLLVHRGSTANTKIIADCALLPHLGFNHAMLKVTNNEKNVYWIDPTNKVSMAQGIFPDVADRDALLLDHKEGGLIQVPPINPTTSKILCYNRLAIQDNVVNQQGTMVFKGASSLDLTQIALNSSNEALKDFIFYKISNVYLTDEEKKFMDLPDFTSSIVQDITIRYAFQQKNKIFQTNLGSALILDSICYFKNWFENTVSTAPDQVSDVFIGDPCIIENHSIIEKTHIKNCEKLNFKIDSPWLSVHRSCTYKNGNTEIIDIVTILKSIIPNEALQSTAYKNLKHALEGNLQKASIVIG
ncbi:DUF3857 domain-containing protein [Candidatus Cardinium hertigii]|uniref:DUF3857 domain-containing protein n=2 Tax=Candidatus Cardinium hertigii TaxID=247481 RepID=A0A3N2QCG8_9BACT|nr:DUF3857 domain-containing protein [Candidatus Cardinium hertigii]ROT47508.1 DUF3857 domain-containing protein [Candidatus Cardinium hertigii]